MDPKGKKIKQPTLEHTQNCFSRYFNLINISIPNLVKEKKNDKILSFLNDLKFETLTNRQSFLNKRYKHRKEKRERILQDHAFQLNFYKFIALSHN